MQKRPKEIAVSKELLRKIRSEWASDIILAESEYRGMHPSDTADDIPNDRTTYWELVRLIADSEE